MHVPFGVDRREVAQRKGFVSRLGKFLDVSEDRLALSRKGCLLALLGRMSCAAPASAELLYSEPRLP